MSEITQHPAGTFCWVELATSDAPAAEKFYTRLFGWRTNKNPMGPDSFYYMFQIDGKDAAALYQLWGEQKAQGTPPHWGCYVAVRSADESAKKAAALGAKILKESFDVFDVGRMAFIADPTGATLAFWQAKKHIGVGVVNQPGAMCWNELATNNDEVARRFYSQLFGWGVETQPMPQGPYTIFTNGGQRVAGMLKMTAEWGNMPPNWMTYFNVADCDASAAKAKSLGGKLAVPPTDIPGVGRYAAVQDPQGAVFSIVKLDQLG